jgi:hypothetical protein
MIIALPTNMANMPCPWVRNSEKFLDTLLLPLVVKLEGEGLELHIEAPVIGSIHGCPPEVNWLVKP